VRKIRYLIAVVIVMIVCGSCISCRCREEDSRMMVTGRYMESEVVLPDFGEHEFLLNMSSDENGFPIIYTHIRRTKRNESV